MTEAQAANRFLTELDARHDQLLQQLDDLNRQIEVVLATVNPAATATPTLPLRAAPGLIKGSPAQRAA